MGKSMRVDFYEVKMPEQAAQDGVTFEGIIDNISKLPSDSEDRNEKVKGVPIRLQSSNILQELREVEMIKIRMDTLPIKASLQGDLEPVDLSEEEGIGEETAFLYHPETKTLVLQNNYIGVSASTIAAFFQKKAILSEPITFLPILEANADEVLQAMNHIKKFDISIARIDNFAALADDDHSVGNVIQFAKQFQAPNVRLTLSTGHWRQKSMIPQKIIGAAKEIFSIYSGNDCDVKKIEITGMSDDSEKTVLDLLDFRMREKLDFQDNGKRRYDYEERKKILNRAWKKREGEITQRRLSDKH